MRWNERGRRMGNGLRVTGWAFAATLLAAMMGDPAVAVADVSSAGVLGASSESRGAKAVEGPRWAWPLSPPRVVSLYAAPETKYSAGHRGIDLEAAAGVPVAAPDDAVVRFSGVVVDRPVLTLDHGGGVLSSYEPLLSELPIGTTVARGAILGAVAAGGHCDASCLHIGVRVNGEYVSPMLFFGRVPPAILLPLGPVAG